MAPNERDADCSCEGQLPFGDCQSLASHQQQQMASQSLRWKGMETNRTLAATKGHSQPAAILKRMPCREGG